MRLPVALLMASLAGCAQAPAPPPTADRAILDADGIAAAALSTADTAERACVHATLRTAGGVYLMARSEATDEDIRKALVANVPPSSFRQQREAEASIWARTHDSGSLGAHHLRWCLRDRADVAIGDEELATCLRAVEPTFVAVSSRLEDQSRLAAMVRLKTVFPGRFTVPQLEALTQSVYAHGSFDDTLPLQSGTFAECLRAGT